MKPSTTEYHAWLLRLWRETPEAHWRIALETVPAGERHGFADLEALQAYLQMVCAGDEAQLPTDEQVYLQDRG